MKETEKRPRREKKIEKNNRKTMIFGAGVLAFAVIGVITVISLIINLTISIFDDSDRKAAFEKFITPVVMVDPVAFSDVKNADEHVLLMSSMWNLLMNVGEETSYPEDEYGMMIIPSSDLDVYAASLFGSDVALAHQTFGNTSINFEYNSETSSYIVPPMGYSIQYQPRVDKISRKGKVYTLTVSYVNSTTNLNKGEDELSADKQMLYVLKKIAKDKYIITSILDVEGQTVSTPSTSSEVASSDSVSSSIAKPETSSSSSSKAESTSSKTESTSSKTSSKEASSKVSSKAESTSSKSSSRAPLIRGA